MKKVAIVMGSDSDLPIVKKAAQVLKDFGVPTELRVLSAHRCAAEVSEFARNAEKNGTGVIIAAAGKAAHLAGAYRRSDSPAGYRHPDKSKRT